MIILDKEIAFDLNDAESIDKLKEIDNKYAEKLKEVKTITEQCLIYKEFFDNALGKGTSDILFEGKNNYMQIIKAYNELVNQISDKLDEFVKEVESSKKKYERYL